MLFVFPYIFFGLSVGGIILILFRNRKRVSEALAFIRHRETLSGSFYTTRPTVALRARVQHVISHGIAYARLFVSHILPALQKTLRFFRGGTDSSTYLAERFEDNTQSGLRVHSLARDAVQDMCATPDAFIGAPPPQKELKIVKRLQNHSLQKEQGGKFSPEEEFWLGVLRQNPRNPHPYKRLAEIYMQRGEHAEARAALAYVLRRNPGDEEAARWMQDVRKLSARRSTTQEASE